MLPMPLLLLLLLLLLTMKTLRECCQNVSTLFEAGISDKPLLLLDERDAEAFPVMLDFFI